MTETQPLPQDELLQGLKAGGREQEIWVEKLYDRHYSLVFSALKKHQIQEEEARDVYVDAILVFRKNVLDGSFRGDSNYFSYLYSIFFRKIFNVFEKKPTKVIEWVHEIPVHLEDHAADYEAMMIHGEVRQTLLQKVNELGQPCREILIEAFYNGSSGKEIAKRLGIKDANLVRSKKFHCLKKLKQKLRSVRLR